MQSDHHAGVLSQTLTSSPCIKQILSARVRTPQHNDVVMVGYSSIHLREYMPVGDLSNVIAHLELGTQILSAKVVSAEARVISVSDPILELGRDEIQFFINGQPCEASQPPQIVVLSTALSELVFVYARILPNGSSQFVHARRPILGGRQWPRKYGTHLAVDPESRALAVASIRGSFGLMALKNLQEIKTSIDQWDPRESSSMLPVAEQIFVQIDGVVLRMDFLKSSTTEPRRVVLLLIVANHGISRLLLYRWDSWQALTTTKPLKSSGYALPAEDAFPHLLIPSCKLLSFAIVTGRQLVFYDDITSKKKTKRVFNIPTPDGDMDKQWVQWAKAVRHEEHRRQKEDIFLIREDGLLRTTVVTHNSVQRAHITFETGSLHIKVDTAVCALSAPPTQGGDVLIACGDTTEGGVFHLRATQKPINIQNLANWSPITDVIHLQSQHNTSTPSDQALILATTGVHEAQSYLTELHYGIEARIVEAIEIDDGASVDKLWVVQQPSRGHHLFLTSHHEHSHIIYHEIATGDLLHGDPESHPNLGFDFPTLAACNIQQDTILQITTNQVHFMGPSDQSQLGPELLSGTFICADVNSETGAFVMASRSGLSLQLVGGIASARPDCNIDVITFPRFHDIDYIPVSLAVGSFMGTIVLLTGSHDGYLHLYEANLNNGIAMLRRWDLRQLVSTLKDPSISSIALLTLHGANTCLILCGLKTGQIMAFNLSRIMVGNVGVAELKLDRSLSIGTTAVSISVANGLQAGDERSAYVTCGSSMLLVRSHYNACGLDYTFDSLIKTPTRQNQELYSKAPLNAIARIERATVDEDGSWYGLLAGVSDNALVLLRIGENVLIPKRIAQIQPTRHLVYSSHLQKCITSVAGRKNTASASDKEIMETKASLEITEPAMPNVNENNIVQRARIYFGEMGEKIRALIQWAPTNGNSHYEMVVIGSDHRGDGRLWYITAKRLSQGKADATATRFATYPKKSIGAICEYGLSSLLVCAGREIKLIHLDMSTKPPRWEHQAEIELPSRATEVRTKGSVIYVATTLHSYMLIREQNQQFQVIESDNWAGKARNIIPHGTSSTLVNLVSDHGSQILNFSERPMEGMRPRFEASLPEAIDKLINLKLTTSADDRERFLGTSIDGTVYLFTTLNEHEVRLATFLEELCHSTKDQGARNASLLAHRIAQQYANKLESAGIMTPTLGSTHARGDVLKALLAPGPYNIYFLMQKRVKVEGETHIKEEDELSRLEDIARPVVGSTQNVIESVILWLRKLLNVPTF